MSLSPPFAFYDPGSPHPLASHLERGDLRKKESMPILNVKLVLNVPLKTFLVLKKVDTFFISELHICVSFYGFPKTNVCHKKIFDTCRGCRSKAAVCHRKANQLVIYASSFVPGPDHSM